MNLSTSWTLLAPYISRRATARILSTLLCAIAIAIRPFSRLGGKNAFLVLTIKELIFSAQNDLAQQLEATILNVTGALVGIGVSALALYLASLAPYNSTGSRAVLAVFLVLLVFIASWIKSRLPRLSFSTRIAMFVSIFMLTTDVGMESHVLSMAGHFLWISLTAAVLSFLSASVLLDWSTAQFAEDIASAFTGLRNSLDATLSRIRSPGCKTFNHAQARSMLLKKSVALNASYQQVSFELRIGRLSVKSIKPLVSIIEHLRRELAWGMSFDWMAESEAAHSDSNTVIAFKSSANELGGAIMDAMLVVQEAVLTGYEHSSLIRRRTAPAIQSVEAAQQRLHEARRSVKERLRVTADAIDLHQRAAEGDGLELSKDLFDVCLFMVSLLQMGHETKAALEVAHRIHTLCAAGRTRLWLPQLSSAWLGAAPSSYALYEPSHLLSDVPDNAMTEPNTELSTAEVRQGLLENAKSGLALRERVQSYTSASHHPPLNPVPSLRRPFEFVHYAWCSGPCIRARLFASRVHRSMGHSSHLKHALKNAGGVALLTLPAFLNNESAANRWFNSVHAQWMIITYIWILETSTGATWRSCYLRLSGTILGAVYAYVTWVICKGNPYGLVTLITAADVPITWLVLHTSVAPLGIVAAITLPPISLTHYVNEENSQLVIKLAYDRGLMIGAGIIAALLVNQFVFPRHCRVLFLAHSSQSVALLNQLYMSTSRQMIQGLQKPSMSSRQKTLVKELQIRGALHRLSILLVTMNDELSLLPKPMRLYRSVVTVLQKTLDLLTGLRKVRENIPQKETVLEVHKERHELISCICLQLFACEVAFRTRHPLPQFIPSARHALDALLNRVEETLHNARSENPHAIGLSLVFAFAEREVLQDLVDTLEELLCLCRKLFGSSAWLMDPVSQPASQVTTRIEGGLEPEEMEYTGWYMTTRFDERLEQAH